MPPPDHSGTQRRAARGNAWALTGFGGSQGMRLAGNIILTRLLAREAFGLMTIVNVVLQGLWLFSDVGVHGSVVQNKRDDQAFLNTAWTVQALRGLVLSVVAAAVALPVAAFYGDVRLGPLVAFVGASAVIAGLKSTKLSTANRQLQLARLTIVDLVAKFVGTAVTITWALVDPTVWALAGGALAAAVGQAILSQFALRGPTNRFAWDRDALHELWHWGKWVFVSTLLAFLATQSDRLVFGRIVEVDLLGVYFIAVLIGLMPQIALRARVARTVLFPLLATVIRDGGDLGKAFRRGRAPILLLGGFAVSGLLAGGPTAVALLYEAPYADAGWMIQLLTIGVWLNIVSATVEMALLANGEPARTAAAHACKVVGIAVCMPIGYATHGFAGAIAGYSLAELFRYPYIVVQARRLLLGNVGQELRYTALLVFAAGTGSLAVYGLREVGGGIVLQALGVAAAVTAAWTPVWLPIVRRRGL